MQASIFMRCSTRKTLLCSNSRGPTGRWVSGKMGGQSPVWCLPKESLVVSLLFSVTKFCPTLRPQGLQHTRLRCPSLSPRVCSHSCPLSGWYYLTITSSATLFSFCLHLFASIRVFSSESALRIRWPKYWSFSFCINPSNAYSGLISFRID